MSEKIDLKHLYNELDYILYNLRQHMKKEGKWLDYAYTEEYANKFLKQFSR